MPQYPYVLFDLDGTLLDTAEGLMKSVDATLEYHGFPPLDAQTRPTFIGPPMRHSLQKQFNLSDDEAAQANMTFRRIYQEQFLYDTTPYPGMADLLLALKQAGIPTAVATYKGNEYAQLLMDHFDINQMCNYTLGADKENKLKKADIIQLCLNELGCKNTKDALYVGDTRHDQEGAAACGLDFVAVTYGFGYKTADEAIAAGAVATFDSIPALQAFLLA